MYIYIPVYIWKCMSVHMSRSIEIGKLHNKWLTLAEGMGVIKFWEEEKEKLSNFSLNNFDVLYWLP